VAPKERPFAETRRTGRIDPKPQHSTEITYGVR
jgi:hypothetical protein